MLLSEIKKSPWFFQERFWLIIFLYCDTLFIRDCKNLSDNSFCKHCSWLEASLLLSLFKSLLVIPTSAEDHKGRWMFLWFLCLRVDDCLKSHLLFFCNYARIPEQKNQAITILPLQKRIPKNSTKNNCGILIKRILTNFKTCDIILNIDIFLVRYNYFIFKFKEKKEEKKVRKIFKKAKSKKRFAQKLLLMAVSVLMIMAMVPHTDAVTAEPENFVTSAYSKHWGRSDLRAYLNNVTKTKSTLPIDSTKSGSRDSNYPSLFSNAEYNLVRP